MSSHPPESEDPKLSLLKELQVIAARGDLSSLQEKLKAFDSLTAQGVGASAQATEPWLDVGLQEKMSSLDAVVLSGHENKNEEDPNWFALQRVFYCAARGNQPEMVKYLAEQRGSAITSHVIIGAMKGKAFNVLQLFLDYGWDINRPIQNTAPVLREIVHNEELALWCLNHGADPMAKNVSGRMDIPSTAGRFSPVPVLKILSAHGVDFRKTNALQRAAEGRVDERVDAMRYLIDECGYPINQREFEYDTEMFKDYGETGLGTALHVAALWNSTTCLEFLIDRGIDRKILDTTGQTAVDVARNNNKLEALAILERP